MDLVARVEDLYRRIRALEVGAHPAYLPNLTAGGLQREIHTFTWWSRSATLSGDPTQTQAGIWNINGGAIKEPGIVRLFGYARWTHPSSWDASWAFLQGGVGDSPPLLLDTNLIPIGWAPWSPVGATSATFFANLDSGSSVNNALSASNPLLHMTNVDPVEYRPVWNVSNHMWKVQMTAAASGTAGVQLTLQMGGGNGATTEMGFLRQKIGGVMRNALCPSEALVRLDGLTWLTET